MNKIIFFLILVFLFSCVDKSNQETYYPNGSVKVRITSKNSNRICFEKFYKNGIIKIIACKENGEFDGRYEGYHENGNLQTIANYNNGKLSGLRETYHLNGVLDNYKYYKDDEYFFVQFFEDNQIIKEHVIPQINQNTNDIEKLSFDVTIPFNDSLGYFNSYIDVFYKFSNDSVFWGEDKEFGVFRFDKMQNEFTIEIEKRNADSLFLKTLSVINSSELLGFLEVKKIKK